MRQCVCFWEESGGALTCTELRTSSYGASGANSRSALESLVPKTDEAIAIPIVPPTVVARELVLQAVPLRKEATGDSPSCEKETCGEKLVDQFLRPRPRTQSTAYQGSLLRNLVFVVTVGLDLVRECLPSGPRSGKETSEKAYRNDRILEDQSDAHGKHLQAKKVSANREARMLRTTHDLEANQARHRCKLGHGVEEPAADAAKERPDHEERPVVPPVGDEAASEP